MSKYEVILFDSLNSLSGLSHGTIITRIIVPLLIVIAGEACGILVALPLIMLQKRFCV